MSSARSLHGPVAARSPRSARDDRPVLAPLQRRENPVMSGRHLREPVPCDYERNPERFRTARAVQRRHAVAADVHERVARRLVAEGVTPVLTLREGYGH